MQRATYRARLAAFTTLILAVLIMATGQTAVAQNGKPLNQHEVIELLEGGVPSARVSEIVDDRGIDFDLSPQIEQKVRDAGGADDVVAALRRATARHAETERPRTGGLVIKTTPGETQVYLNDEPKGMTSPEGEIRLPDLPPGTYNLRVSLLGYQSYEKPMTVAAGEEQTVYVTLVQKAQVITPRNNPPPPQQTIPLAIPSSGIPIPGLKVSGLQFFEGPHDLTLEKSQRVYRYAFDRSSARSIFWELNLRFPAPGQRIEFQVVAVWYKPDGTEFFRQTLNAHVEATWGSSWHALGYGWAQSGHWIPGSYRVDLLYQNARIASGTFQIN
jgi:hypothetical protein